MRRLLFVLLMGASALSFAQTNDAQLQKQVDVFVNLYRTLDMFYVDSLSADTVVRWAIDGMLHRVDPFTEYYPSDDDDELMQMTTGKYAGIGAVIRWNVKYKRTQIAEPYADTPSAKAGLKAGDIIISVDGKDIEGLPTTKVTKMLRGEAGTTFTLRYMRGTDTLETAITRRNIQLPTIPYAGMINDSLAYVSLTGFTAGTAVEMRRTLMGLMNNGMRALVLDLRENPGGSLEEAVDILSLFLPKGTLVVSTRGKLPSSCREMRTTTSPIVPDTLPVVVMVSSGSASAAEIVSGTLQDTDRAVIIGRRTYGKGLVQSIRDMPEGGNLKITTSRYYIPSGRCIQAYDYRHLNEDGSVGTVPDSLTKVFYTAAGREVRDGGGIKPDLVVIPDSLPSLVYELMGSDVAFDYATQYASMHDSIAQPGQFALSDEDYAAFVEFVSHEDFKCNRRSNELLQVLQKITKLEGYYEVAQEEFERLEQKLNPDISIDLMRFRKPISWFLEEEIVTRYFNQSGALRQSLEGDYDFDVAVRILRDGTYQSLLGL